jgi:SAM-dependent methyltransferase
VRADVTRQPSTDRAYLTSQQYATDVNLAARQAIYRFQEPRVDLWGSALRLVQLRGDEAVLDVGCGNGGYLGTLHALDHRGRAVGMDISRGMLAAARTRAPGAHLAVADAQALPWPDHEFDVVLAMHMLYHVPDRAAAIRELRRVTTGGGTVLVVTNSDIHLRELDELVERAAGVPPSYNRLAFTLESGESELRAAFGEVTRHDIGSRLVVTDVEAVVSYVASMHTFVTGADRAPALDLVRNATAEIIARDGAFRIRTAAGCFVCHA